jgi:4-hydroxy-tetrahydrodipicolinate reductase
MLKVVVNGAFGRMGQISVASIIAADDMQLVAGLGRSDDLALTLAESDVDVVVDFTLPDCVYENTITMIDHKVPFVIGTSGLTEEQINEISDKCSSSGAVGLIVPNFSIVAVLMMRFAEQARAYLDKVNIIESHHDQKVDAPSGTALRTAARINTVAQQLESDLITDDAIYSVRLPGLFAHQAVVFHGCGETLTIKHDAMSRDSMMPGVLMACRRVGALHGLHVGLDHLLIL